MAAILPASLDVTRIQIAAPRKTKNGQRLCVVGLDGAAGIYLQTPKLTMPWAPDQYGNLSFSLEGWANKGSPVELLHARLSEIDELVVSTAVQNAFKWFGEPLTRDEIQNLYEPIVRYASGGSSYAPTFRIKSDDQTAWFHNGERLPSCPGQGEARTIIQPSFVYFRVGEKGITKFGVSIKLRVFDFTGSVTREIPDYGNLEFVE